MKKQQRKQGAWEIVLPEKDTHWLLSEKDTHLIVFISQIIHGAGIFTYIYPINDPVM